MSCYYVTAVNTSQQLFIVHVVFFLLHLCLIAIQHYFKSTSIIIYGYASCTWFYIYFYKPVWCSCICNCQIIYTVKSNLFISTCTIISTGIYGYASWTCIIKAAELLYIFELYIYFYKPVLVQGCFFQDNFTMTRCSCICNCQIMYTGKGNMFVWTTFFLFCCDINMF